MSIKDNFPAITPSLNLNFARSKTLDPRITFSRTSTATRVNEVGLIEVVSADDPRFDHEYDSSTGAVKSLGLLVEESRVTYTTHTEDPSQWIISNMITTGNSVTLPTGVASTSIEYRGETTDANSKLIRPRLSGASTTAGDTWVFSIFVKAGTEDTVNITLQNNTATEGVRVNSFNMLTGEDSGIIEFGGATNGEFDAISYPNDWWRIYVRGTFSNNASGMQTVLRLQGFSNQVTVTTSFSAWGAQLEKGSFPTSYIPNDTGSTKTRSADSVSMTGTNFSDWYNQDAGTVYVSQKLRAVQDTSRNNLVYLINDGGGNDYFYNPSRGNTNIFAFGDGGTNYSRFQDGTSSIDTKTAFAYDVSGDDFKPYYNGIESTTETDNNTPSATSHTQLELGATTADKYCGHIQQFTYYPRRLTNTQLQNLTK